MAKPLKLTPLNNKARRGQALSFYQAFRYCSYKLQA